MATSKRVRRSRQVADYEPVTALIFSISVLKSAFLYMVIAVVVLCAHYMVLTGMYTAATAGAWRLVILWTPRFVLDDYTKLICHQFDGRLGNEMFQYASILALAHASNRTPVFIGSVHLDRVLATSTTAIHSWKQRWFEDRCKKVKMIRPERSCCTYSEDMLRYYHPDDDWYLAGFFQSWKYFRDYVPEVRRALTFSDSTRKAASDVVNEFRARFKGSTLVGVHVRKGDLMSSAKVTLGYPTVTQHFLNTTVAYFDSLHSDTVFVVASDSIAWCKANFPGGHPVVFLENHPPAVDLLVLASMDHITMSFGTFSWWAGYLNSGQVAYVNDLFFGVPNTTIGNMYGSCVEDYVYPWWISL